MALGLAMAAAPAWAWAFQAEGGGAVETAWRDPEGRVTLRPTRLAHRLRLDGHLDDEVYRAVRPASGFIQQEPREGEPATEPTEVWVLVDERTLYVSARCWDSQPHRMVANEMRRDRAGSRNESFAVMLDTFHDRRRGFLFETNVLGALHDAQVAEEGAVNTDWNTVWQVRTARFEGGWSAEMAIPFKSLRYPRRASQVWGINFRRNVRWKNERSTLTRMLVEHDITRAASAATLVAVEVPPGARHVEVKPYALAGRSSNLAAEPPLRADGVADLGLDAKAGLGRGLTLDLTYNTDFAQVEADDQQVNLTRFSLFFPEKRDFFLEGQGNFDFGGASQRSPLYQVSNTPVLFFSRRIGLVQGLAVPIVGGGRLTGKAGPYSVGALAIRTGSHAPAGAVTTDFAALRVKRDVLRRSTVGMIATRRAPSGPGGGANLVYGVDATFGFFDNLRLVGYVAGTRTPGRTGPSASYRGQLDFNSDTFELKLERLVVERDFRPEIGFLRRQDFRQTYGYLRLSPRPRAIPIVRKWGGVLSVDSIAGGDGWLQTRQVFAEAFIDWANGDTWDAHYTDSVERLAEGFEVARDVWIAPGRYHFGEAFTQYGFGPRRRLPGSVFLSHGGFFGGTRTALGYSGRLKVSVRLSVEPRLSLDHVRLPHASFQARLLGGRLTYAFSPRTALSALVQYNSSQRALATNARLRWEYRPGSEVFLVYSDGRETGEPGFPRRLQHSVVFKVTRLFRW